jgi:hypothetical protein
MRKQFKGFPGNLAALFVAATVFAAVLAAKLPGYRLSKYFSWLGTSNNRSLAIGLMAYTMFVVTAILLWFARKYFRFSLGWLLWGLLFNGFIIFIKFISSTNNYSKLELGQLVTTAIGVAFLYLAALYLVYLYFLGNILKTLKTEHRSSHELKFLFAAGMFVFINLLRIVVFTITPLSHSSAATYLASTFKGGGLLLSAVLFVIILGAIEMFDTVRNNKRDVTLTFIVTAGLIVMYHIVWVFFVHAINTAGACNCVGLLR